MAVKFVHPQHGATFAHGPLEVERLKATGWTEAPPKDAPKKKPGPKPKAK